MTDLDLTSPALENQPPDLDRLRAENKEITTLYNIGVAVSSTLDLNRVLWTVYKESSRLLETANFAIVIYDEDGHTLTYRLIFDQGKKIKPFVIRLNRYEALAGRLLCTQSPLLVADVVAANETENIQEIDRFQPDRPIRTWLGAPILNPALAEEKVQGMIILWSYQPEAFTDHDLWLLSAIGNQAAIAIRNARLFQSSQRRAAETTVLNDVAHSLADTLNLDEVLTRIMREVESMLKVEAGSLLLTDYPSGDLVFRTSIGAKADEVKPFRVPRGQGVAGEVAQTGKSLIVADVEADKRHFKKLDEEIDFQTRNILCVPLTVDGYVIGVIEVMNKKTGNFSQHDLELLNAIASYAAIAIKNARLHEGVLAERDRVIEAEEQARKKLARDLHDGPTQLVAATMMKIDFCQKAIKNNRPDLILPELEEMEQLSKRASHQMRTMLFELRPLALETQGLSAALQVFLDRRQKDIGDKKPRLSLEIKSQSGEIPRQDGKVETTIFAIVQETVNNAIKHAEADHITVILQEADTALKTIIRDDGAGFEVEAVMSNYESRGSLGMINLQERAELVGGELSIESTPGEGTQVTISIPKEKEMRMKKRRTTGPLSMPVNMPPKK